MRTRDAIKSAFYCLGTTLPELIDTHISYCPTIRATTVQNGIVSNPEEVAAFAARAFNAQAIIRGQARRAWNPISAKHWSAICDRVQRQVNALDPIPAGFDPRGEVQQ